MKYNFEDDGDFRPLTAEDYRQLWKGIICGLVMCAVLYGSIIGIIRIIATIWK